MSTIRRDTCYAHDTSRYAHDTRTIRVLGVCCQGACKGPGRWQVEVVLPTRQWCLHCVYDLQCARRLQQTVQDWKGGLRVLHILHWCALCCGPGEGKKELLADMCGRRPIAQRARSRCRTRESTVNPLLKRKSEELKKEGKDPLHYKDHEGGLQGEQQQP